MLQYISYSTTWTEAWYKSGFLITHYTPYLALMGKLWGDLCENQDENWPRYNGTALYSLCKLVMFHAYDQVAFHVYLYWTQDTIEGISFARDLLVLYCKHRFIPTQYDFMFWNRNLVFKLTTIDVPSGLRTRNFQSSVIHHHEFSLIGIFNVCTCIWETLFEKTRLGYLNFGR